MDRPRKSPQVLPLWMMEVTKIISPETRTTRYSIGQLAKKCGLSRTALLYYEKIGLLTPSARTTAGYRSYNQDDVERLAQILIFREMGIALKEIRKLLSVANIGITPILLNQINEINQQIGTLREQQNRIIEMFRKTSSLYRLLEVKDPSESKALLKQAGFDNHAAAFHWHRNFEHASPQEHARFLAVVGISPTEIDALIRRLETASAVPEQIS